MPVSPGNHAGLSRDAAALLLPPGVAPRGMALEALRAFVSQCRRCSSGYGHGTQLGGSTALGSSGSLSQGLLESRWCLVPFVSFSIVLKKRSRSADPWKNQGEMIFSRELYLGLKEPRKRTLMLRIAQAAWTFPWGSNK